MQGVWRRGETAGEIAMFKKIAQWIRTRQERRLRERVIMKWDYSKVIGGERFISEAADHIVRFILTGELPPLDQDNRG